MSEINQNENKSLKGKWGKIGARPKYVNWPTQPFTVADLHACNTHQCEPSLRVKIKKELINGTTPNPNGTILALEPRKQPDIKVGRPKAVYVLKGSFDPATMKLACLCELNVAAVEVVTAIPVPAVVTPAADVAPEPAIITPEPVIA